MRIQIVGRIVLPDSGDEPLNPLKETVMTSLVQTLSSTSMPSSRRAFMGRTGTLSAVAVALLAGQDAMAQGMGLSLIHI